MNKVIKTALIVVDVQNDFCKGGSLAVSGANQIIPVINALYDDYDIVVATKDWHPKDHKSFASNNKGAKVFSVKKINGIDQVMWPDHCVQDTPGAELHKDLRKDFDAVFTKGENPEIDSYSGFFDNDHKSSTGLSEYLKAKGVTHVTVVGLALDYCVKATALDSMSEGFDTIIQLNATRPVTEDPQTFLKLMNELEDLDLIL